MIKNSFGVLLGGLVLLLGWLALGLGSGQSIERKGLLINTVQRGSMNIQVEGYGKLRSSKQKLLTSQSNATVDEIILKPGALVTSDSVIMKLKNPTLEYEVTVAKQAYSGQQATMRKLKLTQVREMFTSEEKLEEIKANYETASVRKKAMDALVNQGVVSKLDYAEAEVKVKQLKKRTAIFEKSIGKLKLVHDESINIQQEAIEQAKSNYDTVQLRFDQLTVTAGMDGVLQKLPVELGQSLVIGQQIALIGGTEDLVALIKVPQAEAEKIVAGQKASIDTRKDIIESVVLRTSPTVEDGSVEVEIALTGTLPSQLRPEQSVDAVIHIEKIDSAMYIQRPANAQAYSNTILYKLTEDQLSAFATEIEFGVTSGQYIQVISGALEGDKLILSDMSYLKSMAEISLTN